MPIAITDEHQELGATVRGVLHGHGSLAANRALLEADAEPRPSFWQEMADLGWLGIHLPEEHGGAGAGLSELVVVLEELGRQVAPGPVPADGAGLGRDRPVRQRRNSSALLPARPGRRHRGRRARPRRAAHASTDGVLDGDGGHRPRAGPAADLLLLRAGDDLVVAPVRTDGGRDRRRRRTSTPRAGRHAVTVSSVRRARRRRAGGRSAPAPRRWPARSAPPRRPASWRPAPTRRWPTPRSACSSAGPSGPSRPSSTTAPTCSWRPSWPPRPCGTPPGPRRTRRRVRPGRRHGGAAGLRAGGAQRRR